MAPIPVPVKKAMIEWWGPVLYEYYAGTEGNGSTYAATVDAVRRTGLRAVARVTLWQEIGGLVGRFIFAVLAVRIISRRVLLRVFQIPALIFVPLLFWWISASLGGADTLIWIKIGIFIAGLLTIAQFSFWGNFIPLVFPLHLRGTGESFAANIGGRVIGTAAAWITITLSASNPPNPAKIAIAGACVAGAYVLVGSILTQWLPEPREEALKE